MHDITDKIALVTGGVSGIGSGFAHRLCEAGASVVIAEMDDEAPDTAAAHLERTNIHSGPKWPQSGPARIPGGLSTDGVLASVSEIAGDPRRAAVERVLLDGSLCADITAAQRN